MGAGFARRQSGGGGATCAQPAQQSSGAMVGFQINRDQPVKIESLTLEVRDKQHQATFAYNVKLTRAIPRSSKSLVVFYEERAERPPHPRRLVRARCLPRLPRRPDAGLGGGNQQIKRVEARETSWSRKRPDCQGRKRRFDIKTNAITLTGNVVVTQGTNVLTGERMVVNLTTGVTTVESGKSASGKSAPVTGMFSPSAPAPAAAPAPAPAPAAQQKNAKPAPPPAKSAPGAPIRINQNMLPKKPAT